MYRNDSSFDKFEKSYGHGMFLHQIVHAFYSTCSLSQRVKSMCELDTRSISDGAGSFLVDGDIPGVTRRPKSLYEGSELRLVNNPTQVRPWPVYCIWFGVYSLYIFINRFGVEFAYNRQKTYLIYYFHNFCFILFLKKTLPFVVIILNFEILFIYVKWYDHFAINNLYFSHLVGSRIPQTYIFKFFIQTF